MKNTDIRKEAANQRVKLWQIADKLRITDSYFSKKLRKELPQEEKEKIRLIITELKREDSNDGKKKIRKIKISYV